MNLPKTSKKQKAGETLRSKLKKTVTVIILSFVCLPTMAATPTQAPISDCAADMQSSPRALHLTYPLKSSLSRPAKVVFTLRDGHLVADFEVQNSQMNIKANLGAGEYPYQHDVVELFITVGGAGNSLGSGSGKDSGHDSGQGSGINSGMNSAGSRLPYFEFELSPLDQTFNVQINDPKMPFINNIDKGVIHHAEIIPGGWRGQIDIPLENLGWDGDVGKIQGNAYSIFGFAPNRSYWSLSIPNQPRPNFHQPQFFEPFFKCQMPQTKRTVAEPGATDFALPSRQSR